MEAREGMSTPARATAHWRERVGQRIGASVCPERLALGLFRAINTRRASVETQTGANARIDRAGGVKPRLSCSGRSARGAYRVTCGGL